MEGEDDKSPSGASVLPLMRFSSGGQIASAPTRADSSAADS